MTTPVPTETEHLWIPLPDGTRLAARLWLPPGADRAPVPAVFEYIPYRKADMVRARDARNHLFLAQNGFAALRVDMRGSGDSDGVMPDMYAPHELSDARAVIDWIAAQPWCSGRVGMFGTSWGGTAALQANIDAPDALKAVIAVCATHDRYRDDIHHMGGRVLTDTVEWGATLPAILGSPPTPASGPDWMERWRARLEALTFPLEAWLREEAQDPYWTHGSVIHTADRLSRPILAVGGWADRYSNSVMSLSAARPDLVHGIVGPWGHHYPDHAEPGPGFGFQQVALDWWRHWLMDPGEAVPAWPRLRTWMRGWEAPADRLTTRAGAWIESGPTGTGVHPQRLALGQALSARTAPWTVPTGLHQGGDAGDTGYFGRVGGLPLEDGTRDALVFDTDPLDAATVLHGAAEVDLQTTGAPQGQLVLRMFDVAPDGRACRITWAVAGATEPWVRFPTMTYRLAPGHRLRLSITGSCWPMVWPAPPGPKAVIAAGSLTLPVLPDPTPPADPLPPALDLPAQKSWTVTEAGPLERWASVDAAGQRHDGWHQTPVTTRHHDIATDFGFETRMDHHLDPSDPTSATTTVDHSMQFARPDGTAQVRCHVTLRCTETRFEATGTFTADWDGERLATRHWDVATPRRLG